MPKSEKQIQDEIMLAAGRLPHVRIWRQNVGLAIPVGRKHPMRFGRKGMADLSGMLACGKRVEIECKSARGRLSKDQKRWQALCILMHAEWILGRSAASVVEALERHREGCEVCTLGVDWSLITD